MLVDGNPKGVADTKERLEEKFANNIQVILSLFADFQSKKKFDIVWAEGCLPHQKDPFPLLEHISTFVKEKGCLLLQL